MYGDLDGDSSPRMYKTKRVWISWEETECASNNGYYCFRNLCGHMWLQNKTGLVVS